MVEISEESSEANSAGASTSSSAGQSQARPASVVEYLKANGSEALCFALRLVTIYFTAYYLLPITTPAYQKTAYGKAFMAAAATNAFRLHQRMRGTSTPTFSRNFLQELMLEDSCHYLLYCIIFAMSPPVTMALLPVFLYAVLHVMNFVVKAATETGSGGAPWVQKLAAFKTQHTPNILGTIACAGLYARLTDINSAFLSEVFVFPIFFAMIFMGRANIFFPFMYFRFLSLRYTSRRNPYTRMTFANMKLSLLGIAQNNSCPAIVRTLIDKSIAIVERFAPPM
ncbi:Protein Y37D8A.17 [Aphelenchoides avenae]|nr:Protein Y37D8A.17 [Aphelenchus avenae]